MSGSSWNLVVPVLILGLAFGVAWVVMTRRRRSQSARSRDRDRELMLIDLEARQELLYEQLKEASPDEREALELAAARNLMAIEQAGGRSQETASGEGTPAPSLELPGPAASVPARSPSPWLGFVGGVACAALVGVLILWAQRDAQPRPDEGMGAPRAQTTGDEPHPAGPPLSEREREALAQLARTIEEDPTDLMARKQYSIGLLSTGDFMGAFEQAEILLASDAADPDGLYVKAMVRMRMGQEGEARALLDRLVADYPDHVPALTALGVLVLRSGGLSEAEEYWAKAEEFSGGRNPEIERLRVAAREQFAGNGSAPGGQASPPVERAPRAAAPSTGPAYTLQIDLGPGIQVPRSAVLFVSLRAGTGGPPTAVKRVDGPRFPTTVVLTEAEAMMGQPLPDAGMVFARVDFDGSASTRDESEPTAEVQMRVGETTRLTLE